MAFIKQGEEGALAAEICRKAGISQATYCNWRPEAFRYRPWPSCFGQNRRARFRRPGLHILDRRPLSPLCHSLGVDAQFLAPLRRRSLRSLYCSSDGVGEQADPKRQRQNCRKADKLHSCPGILLQEKGSNDTDHAHQRTHGKVDSTNQHQELLAICDQGERGDQHHQHAQARGDR